MQWIAIVALGIALVNGVGLVVAADQPLVDKGKVYQIVWSCLPELGCYSEVVRIDQVRPDGWADVKQCSKSSPTAEITCDEPWRINLSQASAIRPYKLGRAAN
jgi:hypothetical protein